MLPVTESEDAAARGRAIFQRLRAHGPDSSTESPQPEPAVLDEPGGDQGDLAATAEPSDGQHAPEPGADVAATGPEQGHREDAVEEATNPPLSTSATTDGHDLSRPAVTAVPTRNPLPGGDDLAAFEELVTAHPTTDLPAEVTAAAAGPAVEATPEPPPEPPVLVPEPDGAGSEAPATSAFARALPRVMAVANQKGGVGKTTTAVNLGACLADIGYRVLVVDLDPQGNASTGLGINIRDLHGSMYDVILHDMPIEDCVEATSVRNLFCAPSSLDLAGAEIELVPAFSRELRLKRALEEVRDDYDFVLIDCPPSLGLLTVNGLAAATEVVVPIQCEYYALEGLGQLLRNVNLVQRNLNPGLEVSAIILVMYDARTKLADQVVTEVREHFGAKVCRNVVPRTVRLSEAPSFGQPIIAFDSSSRGAIAYRELAKEVSGGTPQRAR
jgi:chromosome partitioning protein